jgi:eukaryotic-like serine/threonine-protein kinase
MTEEPRVQQLLDVLLDPQATLECVCASCPDLLPVVRKRWRRMCRLRADLDALFPLSEAPTTKRGALVPTPSGPTPPERRALPRIPGYEVEAVLGRGGMGIVFRARHLRLNRPVALKMLLGGEYAEPQDLARFQREAVAGAALRHPNIVHVYDVGEVDGRPYFTMEHVEGGSLAQKLAGTPLPAREAAMLLAILAGAVQAAHQSGIVHRDLKPANVLLSADGTPKICDFGLARRLCGESGLTQSGVALGTPSYMAPEQVGGKANVGGPATDIYALGAILYELLTGRPPFKAESAAELLRQLMSQDPVPPSRLNPKVPHDLETICLKCLNKDPPRRYATAAALAEDLHCLQRGEPIAARRPGWRERFSKWMRHRPAAAVLLGVTMLFTIALIVGALWLAAQQAQPWTAVPDSHGWRDCIRDPATWIAMAPYCKGKEEKARKTLTAESIRFDWGMAHAISRHHWLWQVLRRETETFASDPGLG